MSCGDADGGRRGWRLARLLLALVLLNGAVTFDNVWPTLAVRWPAELSVELAALLAVLAVLYERRGALSRRALMLLSAAVVLFALGRYAAVTAPALYGRPVNLYWDLPHLAEIAGMLGRVASGWTLLGFTAGALAALVLLMGLARWAIGQVDQSLRRHRAVRLGLGTLGAVLVGCFLLQQSSDRIPRYPRFSIPVSRIYAVQGVRVAEALSGGLVSKPLPPSPPMRSNLAALEDSDVLLIFVESYGRVTYQRPDFVRYLQGPRAELAAALQATGRGVVSGFVTSPTFGGTSVLAHLTLLSGIEVRDLRRYELLMTQRRPTLVSVFHRAGYRAVAVMPGLTKPWPEGSFYGFDAIYGAERLAYRGPAFGWWTIPDQYAFAALDADGLHRAPRKPLFVFFPTVSTHVPFWPTPPLQPQWPRMLGADPYDAAPLRRSLAQTPEWTDMGAGYVRAVGYFFDTLASYLRYRSNDRLVLVILGDHQPASNVSGEGASWDVPVHVIASQPLVLAALQARGFTPGLQPHGPSLGPMQDLTQWLLQAFNGMPQTAPRD